MSSGEEGAFSNIENVLTRRNTKAVDAEQEQQGSSRIKQDIVRSVVDALMKENGSIVEDERRDCENERTRGQ